MLEKIINISKDFRHYFWIGLLFIVISLFLEVYIQNKNIWWKVFILFMQTIGISMFVASLFSFVVDSYSFQEKLRKLVENIVLKRDFLRDLPIDRKKEALNYLIKPTTSELEKYSNIEDFYNNLVDEILTIPKKNIRSNYNITLTVKYDSKKNLVYYDGIYTYRLYPAESENNNYKKEYKPILVGILKNDKNSEIEVVVNLPDGKREFFTFSDIKKLFTEDDSNMKIALVEIDDFCREYPHVDIQLRVKEYGQNHWINIFFKASQACDGFVMNIICEDDLKIKNYLVFDIDRKYHIDEHDNKLFISCHQWISEGTGVSILVSRPENLIMIEHKKENESK